MLYKPVTMFWMGSLARKKLEGLVVQDVRSKPKKVFAVDAYLKSFGKGARASAANRVFDGFPNALANAIPDGIGHGALRRVVKQQVRQREEHGARLAAHRGRDIVGKVVQPPQEAHEQSGGSRLRHDSRQSLTARVPASHFQDRGRSKRRIEPHLVPECAPYRL
jgi:hypothetical protein